MPQSTWCCLHSRNEIIHEAPGVTFPQEEGERKIWIKRAAAFSDYEKDRKSCSFFFFNLVDERGRRASACLESKAWKQIRWRDVACKRSGDRGGRTMPCCIFITSVFGSLWGWTHSVDVVHHARTTCHLISLSCPFVLILFPSGFHVSLFPLFFNSLTPPYPSPLQPV